MTATYKISYEFDPKLGDFTASELMKAGRGGCDALVFFSILYPEDGSYSQKLVSIDGRTGDSLSTADIWKLWAVLGGGLAASGSEFGLHPDKVAICHTAHESVRALILKREKPE